MIKSCNIGTFLHTPPPTLLAILVFFWSCGNILQDFGSVKCILRWIFPPFLQLLIWNSHDILIFEFWRNSFPSTFLPLKPLLMPIKWLHCDNILTDIFIHLHYTKNEASIKHFFNKCDQIYRNGKLRLIENFIFLCSNI